MTLMKTGGRWVISVNYSAFYTLNITKL